MPDLVRDDRSDVRVDETVGLRRAFGDPAAGREHAERGLVFARRVKVAQVDRAAVADRGDSAPQRGIEGSGRTLREDARVR